MTNSTSQLIGPDNHCPLSHGLPDYSLEQGHVEAMHLLHTLIH